MLYYLAGLLSPIWGPFRLFRSHALLLAGGAFTAAMLTWLILPRLWKRLPCDHGTLEEERERRPPEGYLRGLQGRTGQTERGDTVDDTEVGRLGLGTLQLGVCNMSILVTRRRLSNVICGLAENGIKEAK